jgi:hypothetical protein
MSIRITSIGSPVIVPVSGHPAQGRLAMAAVPPDGDRGSCVARAGRNCYNAGVGLTYVLTRIGGNTCRTS